MTTSQENEMVKLGTYLLDKWGHELGKGDQDEGENAGEMAIRLLEEYRASLPGLGEVRQIPCVPSEPLPPKSAEPTKKRWRLDPSTIIGRWFKRHAKDALEPELEALKEQLAHASGALADINCTVSSIGRTVPTETQKLAEFVLGRILSSAHKPLLPPSWYASSWEQALWGRYLQLQINACASELPCPVLAHHLHKRVRPLYK